MNSFVSDVGDELARVAAAEELSPDLGDLFKATSSVDDRFGAFHLEFASLVRFNDGFLPLCELGHELRVRLLHDVGEHDQELGRT